jgi:hypothetical protein
MTLKNHNGYKHKGYSKTVKLKSGASKTVTVKPLVACTAKPRKSR